MKLALCAVVATLLLAAPVEARDWFVKQGAEAGDGSRERPFHDPYVARDACSKGDTIHVAKGVYSGWLGRAALLVDVPDLTLLGGYDETFATRDPWKNPTELRAARDAGNEGRLIVGAAVAAGFVLDGFVLDGAPANPYSKTGDLVREGSFAPLVHLDCAGATIRNCVFLNGSDKALSLRGEGFVVENNVFMNFAGTPMVELRPPIDAPKKKDRVRGNTFAFAWHASFGEEGPVGAALSVAAPAEVSRNVFVGASHGIDVTAKNEDVALTENVFWLLGASCVRCLVGGKKLLLDEGSLGDLGDAGFTAAEGNQAADPELALDPKWLGRWVAHVSTQDSKVKPPAWEKLKSAKFLDAYVTRCQGQPRLGRLTFADWKKVREENGLPAGPTDAASAKQVQAPAIDALAALKLVPRNPDVKAGARPRKLEVSFAPPPAPAAARTYKAAELAAVRARAAAHEGEALELVAHVREARDVPKALELDDRWGALLVGPTPERSESDAVLVLYRRDTRLERSLAKLVGKKVRLRGIIQKASLVVEAVEAAE